MRGTKKLIEVALPLEAINREAAREKSIRHGHPSTLHLWWARRPLAACRAVLFASIIDDPGSRPDEFPSEEAQEAERRRLFRILEELVRWENSNNPNVLEAARDEIRRATGGKPLPILDPFCGGGSIPLEAQRLGLEAHASDLNPVAVLVTKALIEIPPRFAAHPPVNPESGVKLDEGGTWGGAEGLAEDIRYYGRWIRDEAESRIGHLYPKVKLPRERGGGEATVIAWLWARTVRCPNPACGAQMSLVRSFWLSTKPKRKTWVEPIVNKEAKTVRFEVRTGSGQPRDGTVNRRGAECIVCGTPVEFKYIRGEGRAGRMGARLMAIVAKGARSRVYLPPNSGHEAVPGGLDPHGVPETDLPRRALSFRVQAYGMTKHRDLFTSRQLVALTTFSDLVAEARDQVLKDASTTSFREEGEGHEGEGLEVGGTGKEAYADALALYLSFAVSRAADRGSTICTWDSSPKMEALRNTFARQAIPMTWDFAEGNPFSGASGNWLNNVNWVADIPASLRLTIPGHAKQLDATSAMDGVEMPVIATDPPYYDNIGYADLSDFFYVWLRRSLQVVYPNLLSTLLTPKDEELVATPYRFGGDKDEAERFFERGLRKSFERMRSAQHPAYPLVLFYAFKQAETTEDGDLASVLISTGWETMLEALLAAGFGITGTWPMRSELANRPVASGTNALASSIVLVCRPRETDAPMATRKELISALRAELPHALKSLQQGNVAPVDLAQAAIGPGMAVFSRYSKVLEADGSAMRVGTALGLINQVLDDVLTEQENEFDASTRWAVAWFEQHGMREGPYGDAEVLSKAKATALEAMTRDGFLRARGGKVAIVPRAELPEDWDPVTDPSLTIWEATQYLIRALEDGGETKAAQLLRRLGPATGEIARDLAYRLYVVCERKKWAEEALAYNSLVVAWPEIARLAQTTSADRQEAFDV